MTVIKLKISSPQQVVLSEEVDMVVLPSSSGDMSINADEGERILVGLLKSGCIYLFKQNKVYKRYFITGGLFKVKDKEVFINIDLDFYDLDNLDLEIINNKIVGYNNLLKDCDDTMKIDYYQTKIATYNHMLEIKDNNNY